MAGFRIDRFRGMRPRISELKLAVGEAITAQNVDLGSGDVRPFLDKSTEQAVSSGKSAKTIYRFDNNGSPVWFEFDDYVDIARGPIKDDSLERTYYTGDTTGNGAPKMTNTNLVGSTGPYPEDWVYLGIPAPATALTCTVPSLPEDVAAADRLVAANSIKAAHFKIDNVEYTVYPGTGSANTTWTLNASALGSIAFDVDQGTSLRVTAVINTNKVRLESVDDTGVFARTVNSDKTTVNDWHPYDNGGNDQEADFIGWRIPTGTEVTIVGHNLIFGDVITVSSIVHAVEWYTAISAAVYEGVAGDADWSAPVTEYEDGVAVTRVKNAWIFSTGTYQVPFTVGGSFYYNVDRTASLVSELEDRQYVYTYVSDLGEEGPPSPVSDVYEVLDTSTIEISGLATPPTIGYNITHIRIYRTNSTEAGTEYQFVKEISVAPTATDEVATADLGEVIASTTWDPPDPEMQGITEMPNGILVGFKGKQLYFCEPYFPHAWPAEYDQAVGHNIVGLASFGNSIAVLTDGHPYILSGAHPRNVSIRPVKINQACENKESVTTGDDSVFYASPDGIVEISVNGVRVATEQVLKKKDWATYSPSTMRSTFHEGRYYGFYDFDVSAIPAVIAAEVSGTIATALESDIVNGGRTIIITLTNDIWVAAGASFNNQRANIIAGLTAATSQTLGWNNIIRDTELSVTDVVRTSDSVVTITLPTASGYSVSSDEVITTTIPAAALLISNDPVVCGSTFTIVAEAPAATVTIGGTADTAGEADIVTGGDTITLTLTNDTWVTAGTAFDAIRQGIIDGLAATTNQTDGFNDTVPQEIAVTDVVRTSDTLVTITLPAVADYDTITDESVYAVVPANALTTSITSATSVNSIAILSSAGAASAIITGTAVGATENEIVAGGRTIIITLTADTWVAAGTGPIGTTAQSQALLDAILATTSQTLGWNNVVVPGIAVATDLVRTSNTVATITLDAESTYSIATNETIGLTIPASVLTSAAALVASNTFGITAQAPVTAALTGTVTATIAENDIVDGGKTIILTLTSDTWLAAGTGPIGSTANTQAIIDGIDSAQAEAAGWDAEVKANLTPATDVVRTSDTVCTITLPAQAGYDITAQETITATIPAAVLSISASAVIASPTFNIAVDVPATVALTGTVTTADADDIRDTGATIVLTLSDDTWVASGATFDAIRQGIIDGLDSATSQTNGWNNTVRDVIGVSTVVRTSNTVVTITVPATPTYALTSAETITVTVPASAIQVSTSAVVASPTFVLDEVLVTKVMVGIAQRATATTRKGHFALAENSFTDWDEDAVDSDTASTTQFAGCDVAYSTTSSRWVYMGREPGTTYSSVFHTSDDDGATWTKRTVISPAFAGSSRNLHYNVANNTFLADGGVTGGANALFYSTDGGVTWSSSATPYGSISKTGGYATANFHYGGANRVYGDGFPLYDAEDAAYDYYGTLSGDLSVSAFGAWSEFELVFDASVSVEMGISACAADGRVYYVGSRFISGNNYTLYVSYVTQGSTTETYVGSIASSYAGYFDRAAASPTELVMINSSGYLLTVTLSGAGTIGNWNEPTTSSDRIASSVTFREVIYDPGDTGKEGLGFVAIGTNGSSGAGVIYTSADGVTWSLSETLTLSNAALYGVTSAFPADVT